MFVLVELRQQEREPLLLGLRVLADLGAVEHAVARFLEQRQRIVGEPRAVRQHDERRSRRLQRARRDVVSGARLRRGSAPAGARRAAARAPARPRASARSCRAPRAKCGAAPSPRRVLSARAIVVSSFGRPTGFSRKSNAPIFVASTAVSIVP